VHNQWPALWARVNAEAIAEAGLADEILFFMRAGYTGSQKYCKLMWAGDQLVDFSRHDGLETAISAALSCGVVGNTVSHSDIGGYTTLYGNVRTEEVFMRWAEMNAFTPVMRTHESNRPDESFQFYQSATALAHFARMTRIYRALVPYLKTLSAEAVATGLPTQRPLALHYEADRATWAIHDSTSTAASSSWRRCTSRGCGIGGPTCRARDLGPSLERAAHEGGSSRSPRRSGRSGVLPPGQRLGRPLRVAARAVIPTGRPAGEHRSAQREVRPVIPTAVGPTGSRAVAVREGWIS
jgi:hypothetical protein